jgi:pimeloyl-ACP methyl ester carboxylesterase
VHGRDFVNIRPDYSFDFGPQKTANNGEIEIAYWTFGEGTPLILITGWGTPASSWSVMPKALSEVGYRAIVLDNRDCGKSSPCEGISYELPDMAKDVVAVMEEEGIERTYVFGISMGGMIAQELALNHPEKVEKLILCATHPGGKNRVDAAPEVLAGIFSRATSDDPVEDLARGLGSLMGPGFAEANHEILMALAKRRMQDGSDAEGFMRQMDAILRFDSWSRLPGLKVPSLVIHGDADPLVPYPNGQKIASRIPTELITLNGVGHFVPLEDPTTVFQAITSFFPVHQSAEA